LCTPVANQYVNDALFSAKLLAGAAIAIYCADVLSNDISSTEKKTINLKSVDHIKMLTNFSFENKIVIFCS